MKSITKQELNSWINKKKKFTIIDVREEWEHENYNIGGVLIPIGELISRKDEIEKEHEVVLYCEKGIRSAIAIQRLEALGYQNLYNLEGGMSKWKID